MMTSSSVTWKVYRVMAAAFVFTSSTLVLPVGGHGRLIDPPSRGTMWRLGFNTPEDYNDHELFCGGFDRQWTKNGGRCGECGDPWDLPRPRPHEAGGTFGTGTLGKVYRQGQLVTVVVHLTANHGGWFEFRLCPTNDLTVYAKQSCLNRHVLKLADGVGTRYEIKNQSQGLFRVRLRLPRELKCSHCVLQWHYTTGNNWGFCQNGKDKIGCGKQEVFRGCSDIAIFGPDDKTYYKFLNLTIEADVSPIINIEDGSYQQGNNALITHIHENNESLEDHYDGGSVISHHDEREKGSQQSDEADDLTKLDLDGDGVINIGGNLLSIDALKSHLLNSGLVNTNGGESNKKSKNEINKLPEESDYDFPSSTTRSRSKYKTNRNKNRSESKNKDTVVRSYVTRRPPVIDILPTFETSMESQDKNFNYVPSNTFRRPTSIFETFNDFGASFTTPTSVVSTTSSTDTQYTLGPVIVHKPAADADPGSTYVTANSNNLKSPSVLTSFNNEFDYVVFKRDSKPITRTTLHKPAAPKVKDELTDIVSQLAQIRKQVRTTTTDHRLLIDSVRNSHPTTPQPSTQIQRIVPYDKKISIPNILLNHKSDLLQGENFGESSSLNFNTQTFPTNIFSPIREIVTKSPRKNAMGSRSTIRPQSTPLRTRSSTPRSLEDVQTTIRNLAAQTKLLSGDRRKLTSNTVNTQALSSKGPNMEGAVAFQVPLSKLRDAATVDRLMKMKNALRPETSSAEDDHDPILLIIM